MKKSLLAISMLVACSMAFATGQPPPDPVVPIAKQTTDVDLTNFNSLKASADAAAAAKAKSEADANAAAAAKQKQTATGGSVNDNSSSRLYVLPAPIAPPNLGTHACQGAMVDQKGGAAGWSFVSGYRHLVDGSDCTVITLINSLLERCQFGKAERAMELLMAKRLEGYEASRGPFMDNLNPTECALYRSPRVEAKVETVSYLQPPLPASSSAPPAASASMPGSKAAPAARPDPRAAGKGTKKEPPCPDGKVLQTEKMCVAKKTT